MIKARVYLSDLSADAFVDVRLPAVLPEGTELTFHGENGESLSVQIDCYIWYDTTPGIVLVSASFCSTEDTSDKNILAVGFRFADPYKGKFKATKGKMRCGSAT